MKYLLISGRWFYRGNQLYVSFVARGEDDKKYVLNFACDESPYFFVREDFDVGIHPVVGEKIKHVSTIKVENGGFLMIETFKPSDVRDIRDFFKIENCFEADIPFIRRMMIDKEIYFACDEDFKPVSHVDIKWKKAYVDIECDNRVGFPDANKDRILSIALAGSDGEVYYFSVKEQGTEAKMLEEFFKILYNYDLVLGWYSEKFDFPYIRVRCDRNNLHPNYWYWRWSDVMLLYKRAMWKVKPPQQSYSLEHIARYELGHTKVDLGLRFWEIYEQDYEKAKEYNITDATLVREIDQKNNVSDLFIELGKFAGIWPDECIYYSRLIDTLILRKCHNKFILPSKRVGAEKSYMGATVLEPIVGFHKNLMILDFKGLYPSIVRTFNISFETFSDVGDVKTPSEARYISEPVGMIPSFLDTLSEQRDFYKKEMYKFEIGSDEYTKLYMKQYVTKVVLNTVYGYFGYSKSRVFNDRNSAAITAVGRYLIQFSKDFFEGLGYKVIYGDTDSVIVVSGRDKLDDIVELGEQLVRDLNYKIDVDLKKKFDIKENHIEVKFEKIASTGLFIGSDEGATKKRYILRFVWQEGNPTDELKVVGLETIRSDWCKLVKDVQREIISLVMTGRDYSEIKEYLLSVRKKLLAGEYDDKIVIFKSIKDRSVYKSVPIAAKVAADCEARGVRKFYDGEKVPYIIIGLNKRGNLRAVYSEEFDAIKNKFAAYMYVWIKQVKSSCERVLRSAFGNIIIDGYTEKWFERYGYYDNNNSSLGDFCDR